MPSSHGFMLRDLARQDGCNQDYRGAWCEAELRIERGDPHCGCSSILNSAKPQKYPDTLHPWGMCHRLRSGCCLGWFRLARLHPQGAYCPKGRFEMGIGWDAMAVSGLSIIFLSWIFFKPWQLMVALSFLRCCLMASLLSALKLLRI